MGDIQKTVAEATKIMEQSGEEIQRETGSIHQSIQEISNIQDVVKGMESRVEQIAGSAMAIAQAVESLINAMGQVSVIADENKQAAAYISSESGDIARAANNIAAVGEENSAAMECVSQSSTEINGQVISISQGTDGLAQMSEALHNLTSHFY